MPLLSKFPSLKYPEINAGIYIHHMLPKKKLNSISDSILMSNSHKVWYSMFSKISCYRGLVAIKLFDWMNLSASVIIGASKS